MEPCLWSSMLERSLRSSRQRLRTMLHSQHLPPLARACTCESQMLELLVQQLPAKLQPHRAYKNSTINNPI
jgi:hypothetical protein